MTIVVIAAAVVVAFVVLPLAVGAYLRRMSRDYPEPPNHQPRHVNGRHR